MKESIGIKRDWIPLACIYNLSDEYKKSYTHAHISISTDGEYVKAVLYSNWNSSYNHTEQRKFHGNILDSIEVYTRDWTK